MIILLFELRWLVHSRHFFFLLSLVNFIHFFIGAIHVFHFLFIFDVDSDHSIRYLFGLLDSLAYGKQIDQEVNGKQNFDDDLHLKESDVIRCKWDDQDQTNDNVLKHSNHKYAFRVKWLVIYPVQPIHKDIGKWSECQQNKHCLHHFSFEEGLDTWPDIFIWLGAFNFFVIEEENHKDSKAYCAYYPINVILHPWLGPISLWQLFVLGLETRIILYVKRPNQRC